MPSNREKDDDYHRVVVVVNKDWRVIVCKDGIQWIVQKASPTEWRSKTYHRSREALIATVRRLADELDPKTIEVLFSLPEWIDEKTRAAPMPPGGEEEIMVESFVIGRP